MSKTRSGVGAGASNSKKASEKEKQQKVCDLCTGSFKASEEVLQCEGNCRLHMHRYCAGLAKTQYEELVASSTPFVCLVCTQRLHKAEVLALQNELASLKSELVELRSTIANPSSPQLAPLAEHGKTSPSVNSHGDELRALREEVDKIAAVINVEPRNYAKAAATYPTRPKRGPALKRQSRPKGTPGLNRGTTTTDDSPSKRMHAPRQMEKVEGARKMWGTLRTTTSSAVSSTLAKLTTIPQGELHVKRKYKQSNDGVKPMHWWFVLRGSEAVMGKLDDEWGKVSLQTNWKLMPLLRFSNPDHSESSTPDSVQHPSSAIPPHIPSSSSMPTPPLLSSNDNFLPELVNNQAESPPQMDRLPTSLF